MNSFLQRDEKEGFTLVIIEEKTIQSKLKIKRHWMGTFFVCLLENKILKDKSLTKKKETGTRINLNKIGFESNLLAKF